jgi:hypothetical protein
MEYEAVTAKIANNPKLAKALTDPNLTPNLDIATA